MTPPPQASAVGAQYATQFLSSVLSQRGPDALPYGENSKWLIRQHLVSLVETYPSLIPKSSHFTHNDGRVSHLLHAEGTIPIVYAGVVYNIPATIWLPDPYPQAPPSVFLTPTRDMVVKPNHPHVDRSGHVSVPYLRSWVFPSSNLVDLVRSLSHLFGQDPPLYTRQQPSPNPNPNPTPTPILSSSSRPMSSSSSSSGGYFAGRLLQQHRPMEDPAEVFRRNAMQKIVETVHGDVAALRKKTEAETEGLFSAQAELRRREEVLTKGIREMQGEMEGLEQQLQLVLMNTDVLEGWMRDNHGKLMGWRDNPDVLVEDMFDTADVLSKQLLECTAADLAVEDTIYALDRAIQDGTIPLDKYLKNVRALSRDQFFQRATMAKVRAVQVRAQVDSMAGRAR